MTGIGWRGRPAANRADVVGPRPPLRVRPLRVALPLVAALSLLAASCGADDPAVADAPLGTPPPSVGESESSGGSSAGGADATEAGESAFSELLSVVVPNSPGSVGVGRTHRMLTALLGSTPNSFLGGPDAPVTVTFRSQLTDDEVVADGTFIITDASALGLYVTEVTFPSAGSWEVEASSNGQLLGTTFYEVVADPAIPGPGDPFPALVTPTAKAPSEIAAISTDTDPDPALYRLSIDEAVANGRPTLIAIATPAFCQTALCGPTLDFVKAASAGRDELDVIHVEPFDLTQAREGSLVPTPAMLSLALPTEPWVFVVDADGVITATFEGILGSDELGPALDRL